MIGDLCISAVGLSAAACPCLPFPINHLNTKPDQQLQPNPTSKPPPMSKKDSSKQPQIPLEPMPKKQPRVQSQMKKISRRSSKPIINWFQRKLAGTVRARRASEPQRFGSRSPSVKDKHRRSSIPIPPPLSPRSRSNTGSRHQARGTGAVSSSLKRNTISLNEDDEDLGSNSEEGSVDSDNEFHSSLTRDSAYSPASYYEADEDASVRPLPPSSPPSPSPSRSSSSYLSHSRTFRSMTASTKPTTLLSVDLTGGMAHMPRRLPLRQSQHIAFHIISARIPQGPRHTTHHPRNNPRPSSPPSDDASVLTLASSAFGFPGARHGLAALALSGRGSVADDSVSHWSHAALGDSTSHFLLGSEMDDERLEGERYQDHDVDASVRALRPRSSRRGSWESEASGWSASVALSGTAGAPSPGGKNRSLWTSGSNRTGGLSVENEEGEDVETANDDVESRDLEHAKSSSQETAPSTSMKSDVVEWDSAASTQSMKGSDTDTPPASKGSDTDTPPASKPDDDSSFAGASLAPSQVSTTSTTKSGMETPKNGPAPGDQPDVMPDLASLTLGSVDASDVASEHLSDVAEKDLGSLDGHSIANTDGQTDVWHSAPSTPMPV
ncbi:hypothetical protein A0H81_03586 [Grifola frondosa]|uniref:Uncharacterized protein n=1 Tax=Grifola frondosa TaxID=5627 RepID=A0A1C7MH30_GRIFR|nr:hypothetical protein A0H81_03586 [Grifola frondosa]